MFRRNAPRKRKGKTSRGNFAFRRKTPAKGDVHRLDLKLETDASRRERLRRSAGQGVRIAAALLLSFVFIALLKVVVVEAFWNNSRFQLKDIAVKTQVHGPLSKSALTAASGLKEGDHMLMISLRSVRDRLEALPEVQSAKITRSFPGTIVLDVTQRMPVAWLECPDKSVVAKVSDFGCLLDENGIVVPCVPNSSSENRKLPVVRVDNLTRIALGKSVESPSVMAALKLLKAHREDAALQKLNLLKVDASRTHALTAEYAGGMVVTFPVRNDIEKEIQRLDLALGEASKHHWHYSTVNLLVEHNVPVTLSSRTETASASSARHVLAEAR